MAEILTQRGDCEVFFEMSLSFYFVVPGSKFFPGLYNFQDNNAIPEATPSANAPHVGTPSV